MNKLSAHIKSYWHAAIAIEGAFLGQYFLDFINNKHKFDWYSFAYAGVAALLAPATRAIVAKYPLLSPLTYRVTTKFATMAPKPAVTTVVNNPVTTVVNN